MPELGWEAWVGLSAGVAWVYDKLTRDTGTAAAKATGLANDLVMLAAIYYGFKFAKGAGWIK